ncbi:MAG: 2Fe-2S iron-sulfur cluster-binding protein [Steroidobacteraceae bacterium]
MSLIRVRDRDGVEHETEAQAGLTLMEVLRDLDVGIAALCGGTCSCATCHVHVDPAWATRLPEAHGDEKELLSELEHVKPESRLSCQLRVTDELSGLTVTVAPEE